jgi:SAM-dependent methyltransferase
MTPRTQVPGTWPPGARHLAHDLDPWEARWAPYSEADYAVVLAAIRPDDLVLDIGAGDLRLARRMAQIAQQVIAWEMRPELLAARRGERGAESDQRLRLVCTDARSEPVPPGVTVAVLLMRHCTHYALYVEKLRAAGCGRLITNARWGTGVELIDLAPAAPFASEGTGWYACRRCGATGWAGEDAAAVNETTTSHVTDVEGCPTCCQLDLLTVD